MNRRGQPPLVRHSYAKDPSQEKVEAALELWRRALASRMANAVPVAPETGEAPETTV